MTGLLAWLFLVGLLIVLLFALGSLREPLAIVTFVLVALMVAAITFIVLKRPRR